MKRKLVLLWDFFPLSTGCVDMLQWDIHVCMVCTIQCHVHLYTTKSAYDYAEYMYLGTQTLCTIMQLAH